MNLSIWITLRVSAEDVFHIFYISNDVAVLSEAKLLTGNHNTLIHVISTINATPYLDKALIWL